MPIITQLGLYFGILLGGAVIIETIFSWPGVGTLAIEAIFTRDYQLIQGYVVWMTIIYMLINMLVDISYIKPGCPFSSRCIKCMGKCLNEKPKLKEKDDYRDGEYYRSKEFYIRILRLFYKYIYCSLYI